MSQLLLPGNIVSYIQQAKIKEQGGEAAACQSDANLERLKRETLDAIRKFECTKTKR